jgi:hypothetical protein
VIGSASGAVMVADARTCRSTLRDRLGDHVAPSSPKEWRDLKWAEDEGDRPNDAVRAHESLAFRATIETGGRSPRAASAQIPT